MHVTVVTEHDVSVWLCKMLQPLVQVDRGTRANLRTQEAARWREATAIRLVNEMND